MARKLADWMIDTILFVSVLFLVVAVVYIIAEAN